MRPEKVRKIAEASDFVKLGVPEEWAACVVQAGYQNIEAFKEEKPAVLMQKLNGLRKKNKLDIPALQLDSVEAWLK
jgi:lysyl-tRNA synthetase class 2